MAEASVAVQTQAHKKWVDYLKPRVITLLALFIFILAVSLALFGEELAPYDPAMQSLGSRLVPPLTETAKGFHLLGTDSLGRDVFSLVLAGGGAVLIPAALGVICASSVGALIGMVCGYVGGRVGDLLLLLTNIQLAFPYLLLAIAIVGVLGASFWLVVVVLALGLWVELARVVFVETRQICDLEYIQATRAMGGSATRIILRHVLPNISSTILVLSALSFGSAVVTISGLGFIGIAPATTYPGWGQMLSDGRNYIADAWWLTAAPGLAIFIVVLSVNLIAEALRDLSDPSFSR